MDEIYINSLDEFDDDFFDDVDEPQEIETEIKPDWVGEDENRTTYKIWKAITQLKSDKEIAIQEYGQIANSKTPKSLYKIKKSEVSAIVGIKAQPLFTGYNFSNIVIKFFDQTNKELQSIFDREQSKQKARHKPKGLAQKKKSELVDLVQQNSKTDHDRLCKTTQEVLDLALSRMPIDLRQRLKI